MIETAKAILEILGGWGCDDTGVAGISGPSILATRRGAGRSTVKQRVLVVGEATLDVSVWKATEGGEVTLFVLAADENDWVKAEAYSMEARELGCSADAMLWEEFLASEINISTIKQRYYEIKKEYDASEGEDAVYIDPTAVDQDKGLAKTLLSWAQEHYDERRGGMLLLASEYGEGKTSFCLNFIFWFLSSKRKYGGIPLLFMLNECDAGSLEQFILAKLREDYHISLSLNEFIVLCDCGVFIPVFDAFDQMGHGAGGLRTERDFACLQKLRSAKAAVYVTCRLGFFDQYLKALWASERRAAPAEAASRLLTWRGLDEQSVEQMLGKRPDLLNLLTDGANRELLGGIHFKPLILHVISRHEADFRDLLDKRRDEPKKRRIVEFDIFDLLYRGWLRKLEIGEHDDAIRLCRAIAAKARLDGMNVPISLNDLSNDELCGEMFAKEEQKQRTTDMLNRLPLLDQAKLKRPEGPIIVFRFNAYLEFMIARFVLDDLTWGQVDKRAPIKTDPLTLEIRRMIVRVLDIDRHGAGLVRTIEATRYYNFRDMEYQGGNALSLLLDALQSPDQSAEAKRAWRESLYKLSLTASVLRRLDARSAALNGLDFSRADLAEADFSYATLRNVNFTHADLRDARFEQAGALLTAAFVRADTGGADGGTANHWRVVGGTENGMLVVWNADAPFPVRAKPHTGSVTGLGVSTDGAVYISASSDGTLAETDVGDHNALRSYPLGMGILRAMALVDNGGAVIAAGDRNYLLVRPTGGGAPHRLSLPPMRKAVVSCLVATEKNGPVYAGTSGGDLVRFEKWDSECEGIIWGERLDGPIQTMAVLSNGAVLGLTEAGYPFLFDIDGRRPLPDTLDRAMTAVAYAWEADALFWTEEANLWKCYNVSKPEGMRAESIGPLPKELSKPVLSCSPDGRFVAVGGDRLIVRHSDRLGWEVARTDTMHMDCAGIVLGGVKGIPQEKIDDLKGRVA